MVWGSASSRIIRVLFFFRPLFFPWPLFQPSSSGPRFGVQTIINCGFVEAGRCCGSPSRTLVGPVVGQALNLRPRNTPGSCWEAELHSLYTVQRISEVQDSGGGGDLDGPGGDKGRMDTCLATQTADGAERAWYPTKTSRPTLPSCSRFGIQRETGPCNARQPNRVTVEPHCWCGCISLSPRLLPNDPGSISSKGETKCVDNG